MKKLLSLGVAMLAVVILLTGCGSNNLSMSAKEVIDEVYKDVNIEFPIGETMEIDQESMAYHLGVDNLKVEEAYVSDAMMSSQAHSVAVIKLKDGEDVAAAKKAIEDNANPRKWLCVEAEQVIVENIGNTIILIMSNKDIAPKIQENFKNLNK